MLNDALAILVIMEEEEEDVSVSVEYGYCSGASEYRMSCPGLFRRGARRP